MPVHEPDHSPDGGEGNIDLVFGQAVMKGAIVGLPVMIVFMSAAVWAITDQSLETSVVTALLPGVLLGVFGGGFLGMIRATDH